MESLFLSTIYGKTKPTNPTDIENVVANPWSSRTSCWSLPCTSQLLKMSCNGGEGTRTTPSASDQGGSPSRRGPVGLLLSDSGCNQQKGSAAHPQPRASGLPSTSAGFTKRGFSQHPCEVGTYCYSPFCVGGGLSQTAQGYRVGGRAGARVRRVLCDQTTRSHHSFTAVVLLTLKTFSLLPN